MARPSLARFLNIEDGFYSRASELRSHFDLRFRDPRGSRSDRFVWDYWYVPDQYCLHRTPAYHFFPRKMYADFHKALVAWGRKNLGCYEISPPWLSYYVDGSEQQLHSDVPHGPWAYVYSLTDWTHRKFEGGETLILKPETLAYWSSFNLQKDRELESLVERVPALFNRLVVFDPRFPHGVTRVGGTRDPRQGRLVIHGWFTKPEVYITGGLSRRQATKPLNEGIARLSEFIPTTEVWQGTLILRLQVGTNGKVEALAIPTNSVLINGEAIWSAPRVRDVRRRLGSAFESLTFPRAPAPTSLTVPLIFE